MDARRRRLSAIRLRRTLLLIVAGGALLPSVAAAQGLTGTIIGAVKDEQGGAVPGATVRVTSPAQIGGSATLITDENGQLRFPLLPPGRYELAVEKPGFATLHDQDIEIAAGATIERTVTLRLAGLRESVVVEGAGSRIEARSPGFGTRFGPEDIGAIPTRRASMFDFVRAAPGVSPTSPSNGVLTTISVFGSGTNENLYLIDGMNTTCPCSGVARSEPGVDFIQEVQVHAIGAPAEFGNMQGGVITVVTKQGSERFLYDASFYGQASALTSRPVTLGYLGAGGQRSGYVRDEYQDFTTTLGGPAVRDRLWFFGGYQQLHDHDSQPGTDPAYPRRYEMQKVFAKLTWRLAPGWQLTQSFHNEIGVDPDRPTIVTPFEATQRTHVSAPAMTLGNLTHTMSASTLWDVRVGRFVSTRESEPSTGELTTPSRFDRVTGVTTGAPARIGSVEISRTTAMGTLTHYRRALGMEHQWKVGGQFERGEHQAVNMVPTGVRYEDRAGQPLLRVASLPAHVGGVSHSLSVFATDTIAVGDRLTISAGLRFDHSRASSQDLQALDPGGRETEGTITGLGAMYTWNVWAPRLGATIKLTADGRTMLRASYGRFFQGVLTGELEPFHRGAVSVTNVAFSPATGDYSGPSTTVDPAVNLQFDPDTRAPRTDEYSVGVDRALGDRLTLSFVYVHKDGDDFIGWTDVAGQYVAGTATLADGRSVPVLRLDTAVSPTSARRFLLTNPDDYSLTYHGLVMAAEKRRSEGWQGFASYTWSRASGLQASSGSSAAGVQSSTVSPPQPSTFGRDPNDLTNARGRLPNDRPHIARLMGSVDIARTGLVLAANLQQFSGKPWAATAQVILPQEPRRILLEPRGSRRLSSQTLLDVRLSRGFSLGTRGRIDVLLDVLNLLDDTSEESLATETQMTETVINATFGQPVSFVDPRRAMIGVRLNLGR
jgi:hypothetical protein